MELGDEVFGVFQVVGGFPRVLLLAVVFPLDEVHDLVLPATRVDDFFDFELFFAERVIEVEDGVVL